MKCTAVLNGCSGDFHSQAGEVRGFLDACPEGPTAGNSIIFYSNDSRKQDLIAHSPTSSLKMVKVKRHYPESALEILTTLERDRVADLYLFPGNFFGSEMAVRFAYRMGGSSLVAVNKLELVENQFICYKAVYANYLQGKFLLRKKPFCLSIAKGSAAVQSSTRKNIQEISEVDMAGFAKEGCGEDYQFTEAETGGGLEQAQFILVAGRGVKSKEKAGRLKEVAGVIGAELGVSRPVAMSAWTPLHRLVGVSGAITKPRLCIAAGVSGAAAFFAGIEQSERIIAINTDEGAPLVQAADVAVIDDYEPVLDELVKLLIRDKKR
ncbi:MAG: FAD-binding protein [Bacillota bacterium]